MKTNWMQPLAFLVMAGVTLTVAWRLAAESPPPGAAEPAARPELAKQIQQLGGTDRYLTHLSTDKPIYKPGEQLYVRGVMLHHATRQPLEKMQPALVEIMGPKGDVVASGNVQGELGSYGFEWEIPQGQAGGQYTVKMSHPWMGHAPGERTFDIRNYRAPRLKTQIEFLRDGYGPGDTATATLEVERAEGGVPAGAKVTVIARVDGAEVFQGDAQVDAQGTATTSFQLPLDIRRGEGTLAMVIEDGGVVETASKTIPILLQTVDLTMFPESGELVAGIPSRVYLEAFTPAKKPADLAGVIVDGEGQEVAKFRTTHEGRGRFELTPEAGQAYRLKITEPAGIQTEYKLPQVKKTGAVILAEQRVYEPGEKVSVKVAARPTIKGHRLEIRQRERIAAERTIDDEGFAPVGVALEVPSEYDGVLTATLYDGAGQPLAERLLFRRPAKQITVKITPDRKQYTPGGKASLKVETFDAAGKPVSAVVGVSVTDDSVQEMIETREQAPQLPVMVLLEPEVQELADAQVYLDPENEDAPAAVDLLLGTQGWRRFAYVNLPEFIAEHGDDARRAVALRMESAEKKREVFHRRDNLKAMPAMAPLAEAPLAEADGAAEGFPVPDAAEALDDFDDDLAAAPAPQPEEPEPAAKPAAAAPPAAGEPFAPAEPGPGDLGDLDKLQAERFEVEEDRKELDRALRRAREKQHRDQPFAGGRSGPIRSDFKPVRIYAHQVRPNRQPNERVDFAETLFWHAGLKTDENGQGTIEFGLSDSVTSFRVLADAYTLGGALGAGRTTIDSVEPFYVEPKMPLEVTSGDYVQVPIGLVNATDGALAGAKLKVTAAASEKPEVLRSNTFDLTAGQRVRSLQGIKVGKYVGEVAFTYAATAGSYSDQVTRKLVVKPAGFPLQIAHGGLLGPGRTATHEITIPGDVYANSVRANVTVYPTPLANMTGALESLIRQPYGCFEQTSSSTFPLVMAQQYFQSHQGVDPALISRSEEMLAKGYDRLIGFESPGGGFEWFGGDPGHDALTAYGILEFTEMSKVRPVDVDMLARTTKWLLAQRDGKGGYERKTHTLHTWVADPECANAYNTWALLEAGVDADLSTEIEWVSDASAKMQNTYALALAANVLQLGKDGDGAARILDELAGRQEEDGSLKGATTSVVGSSGESLKIETTALAMLAWLRDEHYVQQVENAREYLAGVCQGGRFGSTQSTILALKAIVAYDAARAKPKVAGQLQLLVDGEQVGEPVPFTKDTEGGIELSLDAKLLSVGDHKLQVVMTDGAEMPYSVSIELNRATPDSSEECKLHLETKLNDEKLVEGAATEANVVVINRSDEAVPNPVAIIGVPGGLEVRHDQLKELVKAEKIAAYEVLGREVVLYWRSLDAEQRVELPLSLIAEIPGRYTAPASRAYLYYGDEHKIWQPGLACEIKPRR